jgi:ribosomal protein S18 acetylase RimI-like enzyme
VTPTPVRPAQRSDLPAVSALWVSLLENHAALDPVFALRAGASAALASEVVRAFEDADTGLFVADADGRIAGFCAAHFERGPALARESCRAEITELVVESASRRRGIGRSLADAALGWARRRGAVRVEVRVAARNDAGQAFWRSLGFGAFVDVLDRRL